MGKSIGELRDGWFELSTKADMRDEAGIYEWRIEGVGLYVGKSRNLKSRVREYINNVRKQIERKPYRKGNPDGFREVHRELFAAHQNMVAVTFSILGIYDRNVLNEREQAWIKRRRDDAAKGGLRVLNSEPAPKLRR